MKRLKKLLGTGFKPLAAALALTALGLAAAPASAATVAVTTTTDQSLGDCSGSCSLRDAVATAAPGDTIQIPAGHYVLTLGVIDISKDLTLEGSGARTTIIDGNASSGIFLISGTFNVELDDLSLINGNSNTGGAIGAFSFDPPAVLALTIRRCTFANNQASFQGAALSLQRVALTIEDSTFSNNHAGFFSGGGAISALGVGGTIVNSTFSGNTAGTASALNLGGIAIAPVSLINNTITANQATRLVAAISAFFSGLTLSNNVIAGNVGGDCRIIGTPVTDHNLDSDNSCGFTGPGDLSGVAALLGPLADNGGPTDTHALLAGSPALDAGNNSTCPAADQRGVTRPQGPFCDMGAFELVPPTPEEQIAALIDEINALVTEGALAPNKANPLLTKLEGVADKLDGAQVGAACNQLGAFINQVNAYIGNGTLMAAQGQELIDAANAIKANIGC